MTRSKKTKGTLWLAVAACLCLSLSLPASAQWGGAKDMAEKLLKKDKEEAKKDSPDGKTGDDKSAAPKDGGTIVFSKSPIAPAKPENLTSQFKTGDSIYAVIRIEKTWRELLGNGDKDAKEIQVPVDMLLDGEKVDFQYITIKNAKAIDSTILVLDIAPDPAKMTAYKDEGFSYGEGKGNRKIGPDQYTYNLGSLKPGKHTVKFQVRSYGDIFSAGEFIIEGDDYKPYTDLREKILQEMMNVGGMPKSQKTDVQLEAQMMKLLLNGGWKSVRRLVIVDKDWWIDRHSGGNSAVVGRHIAAGVAAKAEDGSYFWSNVTFQQLKQIDGSFGPLEISATGIKRAIKEENIDK